LHLLEGNYVLYASRGPQYTVSTNLVAIVAGTTNTLSIALNRALKLPRWISADTHIHTLTLSRHGDATLDERLVTLAGEAVDAPIATEHNQNLSYGPRAAELGLTSYIHPVDGNEVTTRQGHFNLFPVDLNSKAPDASQTNWTVLIDDMRRMPGEQVVILNHPCDTHAGYRPFDSINFNWVTGANLRGPDFTFDAMEVINSGAMRSDWMEPFRGWFGLLNRGLKITGVAGSDSHDVSRFIVGQGRTYIASEGAARRYDPESLALGMKQGRCIASLGLIPIIQVDGQYGPGDLAPAAGPRLNISVDVETPPWLEATHIALYINGKERNGSNSAAKLVRNQSAVFSLKQEISRPGYDFYLVAIASGPAVTAPFWEIARPYQPTSRAINPVILGATNPVYVDGDGDGKWSSPRDYAKALLEKQGANDAITALAKYDWAVAAQLAEMLWRRGEFESAMRSAEYSKLPPAIQAGFIDFAAANSGMERNR
jgi:hypothetical protein